MHKVDPVLILWTLPGMIFENRVESMLWAEPGMTQAQQRKWINNKKEKAEIFFSTLCFWNVNFSQDMTTWLIEKLGSCKL